MLVKLCKIFTKKKILICIALLSVAFVNAQTNNSSTQRDTLAIYKKIKKAFYKHKATTLLYHAIFVDPNPQKYEVKPLSDNQKKEDPNLKFNGKIIRNVTIEVYDPFGYSVNDTSKKEINILQLAGNKYHVTTRHWVIRNLMLLKPNDTLDPVKISESERLIRSTRYIRDARIYVDNVNKDSVDLKVFVQDRWAIDAPGSGGVTGGHLTLRDRNIFGSGQLLEQYAAYNIDKEYEFSGRHTIENISNSFISSSIYYSTTNNITNAGISFDRGFYTALTKWAGGAAFGKIWGSYDYTNPTENEIIRTDLDYYNVDTWIGRSINTGTGKHINRRFNNVIAAFRYAETQYQKRPSFSIDTNMYNVNNSLYLTSLGFSLSKYYKDQYIFRFGANEDIPEGIIIKFLYGLSHKEYRDNRYYAGVDFSRGKHYDKIGYFSVNGTYGSFFNDKETGNATLRLGFTYFTDLLRTKGWYYRQFIYVKYVNGVNKPLNETITLRTDELYGFNSGTLTGNSKIILNFEGVTYAPYNFIGFRFAPLVLLGYGMLETREVKLFAGHLYQSYAIGLLIRNESLLNASFQITFGAYPYLTEGGTNYTKFNPVTSFTVKVRSFAVSRPEVVSYD